MTTDAIHSEPPKIPSLTHINPIHADSCPCDTCILRRLVNQQRAYMEKRGIELMDARSSLRCTKAELKTLEANVENQAVTIDTLSSENRRLQTIANSAGQKSHCFHCGKSDWMMSAVCAECIAKPAAGFDVTQMLQLLRAVEWVGHFVDDDEGLLDACPCCGEIRESGGSHLMGCWLAAAIRDLEAAPAPAPPPDPDPPHVAANAEAERRSDTKPSAPPESTEAEVERLAHEPCISFAGLRAANVPRVRCFGHELNEWTESQWSNAIAGEVGELCNMTKKRSRAPGANERVGKTTPTVEDIANECADIVIYTDLMAASVGVDLGAAVLAKFNAVSAKLGPDTPTIRARMAVPEQSKPAPAADPCPHLVVRPSMSSPTGWACVGCGVDTPRPADLNCLGIEIGGIGVIARSESTEADKSLPPPTATSATSAPVNAPSRQRVNYVTVQTHTSESMTARAEP